MKGLIKTLRFISGLVSVAGLIGIYAIKDSADDWWKILGICFIISFTGVVCFVLFDLLSRTIGSRKNKRHHSNKSHHHIKRPIYSYYPDDLAEEDKSFYYKYLMIWR